MSDIVKNPFDYKTRKGEHLQWRCDQRRISNENDRLCVVKRAQEYAARKADPNRPVYPQHPKPLVILPDDIAFEIPSFDYLFDEAFVSDQLNMSSTCLYEHGSKEASDWYENQCRLHGVRTAKERFLSRSIK